MKKILLVSLLITWTASALAADVVTIPIQVNGDEWTIEKDVTVPTSGEYYYTYQGSTCYLSEEKAKTFITTGGQIVKLKGKQKLYCVSPTQ